VAALALLVLGGGYAFYALVWSAPDVVAPPPLPAFGQKSQAPKPEQQAKTEPPKIQPAPVAPAAPASMPTVPADGPNRVDRVRKYVEQYDGGDCFFMLPVAISSNAAVIEGYGTSTIPFDSFDRAFKRDMGFEASIGVRQITQAQCPAIKFLSQLGVNQARAPRINLAAVEVKNGDTLSGTIENFANRVVELLLVSDSGEVQNLSYLLKPGTDSLSFSIGMQRSGGASGPQLIMAVATSKVLDSLRQPRPMPADTFFLQAISEAQRNNVIIATAARFVRLRN
jgi:serine/threonine-protein kinase